MAGITATGAATILTNFGTLELNGGITDNGDALTLSIANAGDTLFLDAGVMNAHTVSFGGVATLELNAASLAVATALALGDSTLKLDGPGALVTDASGVTISGGTISGPVRSPRR